MIAGLSLVCKGTPEERLKLTFDLYDADGSGTLNRAELFQVIFFSSSSWNLVFLVRQQIANLCRNMTHKKNSQTQQFVIPFSLSLFSISKILGIEERS